MEHQIRLATNPMAIPLPVTGEAEFRKADGAWCTSFALPETPPDHIIVPSFCSSDSASYTFTLTHQSDVSLQPVPSEKNSKSNGTDRGISTHVDCWHTHKPLSGASVTLRVRSRHAPDKYVASVSLRPLSIEEPPLPASEVVATAPTPISQMLANADIRRRICSPTALAMALDARDDWEAIVQACYDEATRSYGCWPLAARYAGGVGTACSVEVQSDWEGALALLKQDRPIVCSIRFGKDELDGAPLESTGGHLVCLYGISGGKALVMDPAADDDATVAREFALESFSRAWLSHRGAAYFIGGPL